jgi:hypothetical protein
VRLAARKGKTAQKGPSQSYCLIPQTAGGAVSALALGRFGNRLALRKGFLGSGFLGHRLVLFDVFDFRNKTRRYLQPTNQR